ncbi:ABC transporter permease [Streptomyces avermitilis]|uniref:ABC transporter permease n=1 Tax=Streptomyces avermitilis TaxID=33903 RepID=UPI0021198E47|nr:ABC transporter permease subunit [Streptomyces avermitilis]
MWTVRSTSFTLLLAFVLSTGLGTVVAFSWRGHIERVVNFSPLFAGLYGVTLGQLALVVFGVLLVGSEYSSGSIRTSLSAVPRRGLLYGGKVLAGTLAALAGSTVTVIVTFAGAQAALGPYGITLTAHGVPAAVVGAIVYLTLICTLSMGIAAIVRSSAISLGVLLPLLFLGSQGLGNVPALKPVLQYLPDQGRPGTDAYCRTSRRRTLRPRLRAQHGSRHPAGLDCRRPDRRLPGPAPTGRLTPGPPNSP